MKAGVHEPTYRSWQMMKNRCLNPNAMDHAYYGARGITVTDDWSEYEYFLAAMGERPEGTTLDRRDGDLGYSVTNCRWATRQVQSRNRDYTLNLTFGEKTQKVWEWAAELGIKPMTLHHRRWQHSQGAISLDRVFMKRTRKAYR